MYHFLFYTQMLWAEPTDSSRLEPTEPTETETTKTEATKTEAKTTKPSIEELATEVRIGEIYVNNESEGYRVFVDGMDTELQAPILLPNIPVGDHHVELRTECTYQRKKITVREGLVERAEFQLTPFDAEKPPLEEMIVTSQPDGAIVVLDGQEVGNTPWKGMVTCGTHELEMRIFGYLPQETTFHASIFDPNEISLQLKPEQYGTLVVKPTPLQTKIVVNGIEEGSGPMSFPDIPIGSYRLEFSAEGYQNAREVIKIRNGEIETLEVVLLPEGSRGANPIRKMTAAQNLYVSTTAVMGGTLFAYLSLMNYVEGKGFFDEYLEIPNDSQANNFYNQKVMPYRNRSVVFGVSSGILYTLGAYFFVNRGSLKEFSELPNSQSSESISEESKAQ